MTSFIPSLTLPAAVFANPAASILLPILIGSGVGYACSQKNTEKTYKALKQPPFRPPPWVFGPAWTILYGLMGYGAYRLYSTGMSTFATTEQRLLTKQGATLYTIQLGLNFIWMPLFFVAKRPIEAAVDIVTLTSTVGYMAYIWGQVDTVAAWTLVPYLAWLSFATYLNVGFGVVNDWDTSMTEAEVAEVKAKDL